MWNFYRDLWWQDGARWSWWWLLLGRLPFSPRCSLLYPSSPTWQNQSILNPFYWASKGEQIENRTWVQSLSTWYWSRNGDLQLIWGALLLGARPSRTFINLPNFTFWYCLYHPPTFPLRIAAAKRRNDAGRQLDSWCYIICLELQLSYPTHSEHAHSSFPR